MSLVGGIFGAVRVFECIPFRHGGGKFTSRLRTPLSSERSRFVYTHATTRSSDQLVCSRWKGNLQRLFPALNRSLLDVVASMSSELQSCNFLSASRTGVQPLFRWGATYFSKVPPGFEKFKSALNDLKASTGNSSKPRGDKPPELPISLLAAVLMAIVAVFVAARKAILDNEAITEHDFLWNYVGKNKITRIDLKEKPGSRSCSVVAQLKSPEGLKAHLRFEAPDAVFFQHKIEAFQRSLGRRTEDFVPIHFFGTSSAQLSLTNNVLAAVVSLFVVFLFISAMVRKLPGLQMGWNKAKAVNMPSKQSVKFTDIAGMENAKVEIQEFVDFLKHPKKYEKLGACRPKGALLVGDPGTGKTLLAKAVAGEASVPFFSVAGTDFVEMFVGLGASRVRQLFDAAKKAAPSIIFIDEVDAIGRKRAGSARVTSNSEQETTLNQLLIEMDGFEANTGVVVLAATNRSDILDPALTRSGRMDRSIAVERPDLKERRSIFEIHLKPIKIQQSASKPEIAKRLAALTPGFVGADIKNVCNEAAILAARNSSDSVSLLEFEQAAERVLAGIKSTKQLTDQNRRIVAFHEAGHTLAGWFLRHSEPVVKVTIVPRSSGALGFSQQLPDEAYLRSKEKLLDLCAVLLGGRASEELCFNSVTTGAADDLSKATKLMYAFVSQYGMHPEVGLISVGPSTSEQPRLYSEELAQVIDGEVRKLLSDQYKRVKVLLTEKKQLLQALGELLLAKETLTYNQLRELLGDRPWATKELDEYAAAAPSEAELQGIHDQRLAEKEPSAAVGEADEPPPPPPPAA